MNHQKNKHWEWNLIFPPWGTFSNNVQIFFGPVNITKHESHCHDSESGLGQIARMILDSTHVPVPGAQETRPWWQCRPASVCSAACYSWCILGTSSNGAPLEIEIACGLNKQVMVVSLRSNSNCHGHGRLENCQMTLSDEIPRKVRVSQPIIFVYTRLSSNSASGPCSQPHADV